LSKNVANIQANERLPPGSPFFKEFLIKIQASGAILANSLPKFGHIPEDKFNGSDQSSLHAIF